MIFAYTYGKHAEQEISDNRPLNQELSYSAIVSEFRLYTIIYI